VRTSGPLCAQSRTARPVSAMSVGRPFSSRSQSRPGTRSDVGSKAPTFGPEGCSFPAERWRTQSVSLRELLQQQFGLLEDRRVEALGEPAVNWCEEVAGFGAFALVSPKAREAHGGANLP
jgi:hypothetical protein